MNLTTARLAGISMLCMMAGTMPDASAYSHHYALQDYQVYSNDYSVTVIYDDLGFEMYNTGWHFGPYTYGFTSPYAYYDIHHWVYDWLTGDWVFEYRSRFSDYNYY